MVNNLTKNKINLVLLGFVVFFLLGSADIYAQPFSGTETVSVSATVPVLITVAPTPSGGSTITGSGSIRNYPSAGVFFSGRAYPLSKVYILKDGQMFMSTIAGADSNFFADLGNIPTGDYTFSVYATDKYGVESARFTFKARITGGLVTSVTGIFIAPTIRVDKKEVRHGDNIIISGHSASNANIFINLSSPSNEDTFFETTSNVNGEYSITLDTSILNLGNYILKSKASKGLETSPDSYSIGVIVGTIVVPTSVGILPQVFIHFLNIGSDFISDTLRVNTPFVISPSMANFLLYFFILVVLLIILLILRYLIGIYVRNIIKKEKLKSFEE